MTERTASANIGLNAGGADAINSTFVVLSTFVLNLNISNPNPPLRKAENRYVG